MARHAQPREVAKLKGSVKKNPQRYKGEVPKNQHVLGDPPAKMPKAAKAAWFELQANCLPGVITGAERFIFEIASNLLAEYRSDPLAFPATKYTHLVGVLGRLGLSPADRQKLQLPKNSKDDDPFEQFMQSMKKTGGKSDA